MVLLHPNAAREQLESSVQESSVQVGLMSQKGIGNTKFLNDD